MDNTLIQYTNEHSRFMVLNGAMVHYRDEGQGYPVVLLHGAFSSLHTFDACVEELKKDFRIIRYDLLSFGLTGRQKDDDYRMESQMKVLLGLLNALEIERCVLCGSSLGGWLAWEFALKYPSRVRKLVLMNSSGFLGEESIPLPFKMTRIPFVEHLAKLAVNRVFTEQFLLQVFVNKALVTEKMVDRYHALFARKGNIDAFMIMTKKTEYKDNSSLLVHLQVPTLLIWGDKDKWIPLSDAHRFVKYIPQARLLVYKGVGHLPMEETPKSTALDIKQFIYSV